jgi:hypothetical protein
MMSSSSEHHDEAERLLALAGTEQDSVRRSLILAEAQVHATLALADTGGKPSPPRTPPVRDIEPHDPSITPARPAGQPYPAAP